MITMVRSMVTMRGTRRRCSATETGRKVITRKSVRKVGARIEAMAFIPARATTTPATVRMIVATGVDPRSDCSDRLSVMAAPADSKAVVEAREPAVEVSTHQAVGGPEA